MGVLNVTPDSFSDGGVFLGEEQWKQQVQDLLEEGADLIDIGGESTRPGAEAVPAEEQIARILKPIQYAVQQGAIVSVDTTSPEVARVACQAGALVINDISCLANPELARVARESDAWLLLMHSRGAMQAMTGFSTYPEDGYRDVVVEVAEELRQAQARAMAEGVARTRIWLDPGLGFHKSAAHSYAILRGLSTLTSLGILAVGASRKSFLTYDVQSSPQDRLGGSIAAGLAAKRQGARILRVHDVLAMRQALAVEQAIFREVLPCSKGSILSLRQGRSAM